MRAMIVTILVPDDWSVTDVCTSCNIGIKAYAEKEGKTLRVIDYNSMVIEKFTLANPSDAAYPAVNVVGW
jgi:hypothetical protein